MFPIYYRHKLIKRELNVKPLTEDSKFEKYNRKVKNQIGNADIAKCI